MRGAALVVLIVVLAGCGSNPAAETTPKQKPRASPRRKRTPRARGGRRHPRRPSLTAARLDAADLVVVPWNARRVAATARRHPSVHFVLVGRSYEKAPGSNVAGILFREDEAAYLAGVVAGS
jgi:hypothetical protein